MPAAHLKQHAHAAEERPGARFNAQAPIKEEAPRGVDQATLCRAAAVSLALVAHLPSLLDGDVRDVLDPDYDSEESLIEALRTCAFGVDGGGCRRPASCVLTLLLKGSSTITKRLINVLLHGRVAWRAFDVALAITQDHAASLAGVGLTICAHPLHAEAVSWTGSRSLLLATVFVLEAVKRHLDGDSVGGALFTLVACAAHAAAAASPFLMMAIHSNDLAPSMLAACLGAWLFLGIDGSRVYDAQARAPQPIDIAAPRVVRFGQGRPRVHLMVRVFVRDPARKSHCFAVCALRPRAAVSSFTSFSKDGVCPGLFLFDYSLHCALAEASYHQNRPALHDGVLAGHRRMFDGLRVFSGFG